MTVENDSFTGAISKNRLCHPISSLHTKEAPKCQCAAKNDTAQNASAGCARWY
jgi:hypothetical protein